MFVGVDKLRRFGKSLDMGNDLETFRKQQGLTYVQLAALIGASSAGAARAYALGVTWPREARMDEILRRAEGVDLHAMYERRRAWLRDNPRRSLDGKPKRRRGTRRATELTM